MYCRILFTQVNQLCKRLFYCYASLFLVNTYACEQPIIIVPGQHEEVVSARPVVSWLPVKSAIDYEVTIQSRVPEGAVVTQFTTTTADTKFVSQTALSRDRSIVLAKVKARCASPGVSSETERIFFVDVRATCPLPTQLVNFPMGQFARISWASNPLFDSVEVRAFAGSAVGKLEQIPRSQSFAVIPVSLDNTGVIGVRGICKDADGPWAWIKPLHY